MITINLFDANWWYSFKEIIFLGVNKPFYCKNYKKVGRFISFEIINVRGYFSNPRKYYSQIYLGNSKKPVPSLRIEMLLTHKSVFFSGQKKYLDFIT